MGRDGWVVGRDGESYGEWGGDGESCGEWGGDGESCE